MNRLEIIKEMKGEGYTLSSSYKNNKYTLNLDGNGLRYTRIGTDFDQCLKSLKFDIK